MVCYACGLFSSSKLTLWVGPLPTVYFKGFLFSIPPPPNIHITKLTCLFTCSSCFAGAGMECYFPKRKAYSIPCTLAWNKKKSVFPAPAVAVVALVLFVVVQTHTHKEKRIYTLKTKYYTIQSLSHLTFHMAAVVIKKLTLTTERKLAKKSLLGNLFIILSHTTTYAI